MKFGSEVTKPPLREVRYYRILRKENQSGENLIGFEIEATDQLPDEPQLWFERSSAILHHHGRFFIVLPDIPDEVLTELKEAPYTFIDEKYQRRYSDSLSPFGMQPQGTARLYEVPILQPHPNNVPIRSLFKDAIDIEEHITKNHGLSGIFSA